MQGLIYSRIIGGGLVMPQGAKARRKMLEFISRCAGQMGAELQFVLPAP